MIKRIKYGCFALLFISTLTLSSIVAILASSSAGLDNSFLLTYDPPAEIALLSGQEINKIIKNSTDYNTADTSITSITFGKTSDENLAKVENADRCESVAVDGSPIALLYQVGTDIYILSPSKMLANSDSSYMFYNLTGITSLTMTGLDTTNVTTMRYMFGYCSALTKLDLSGFNTSNVNTMRYMFRACSGLTSLDLTPLDTSNVTNMGYMFDGCGALKTINLTKMNTTKVTVMNNMFSGCSGLSSIDVSSFNTEKVLSMYAMFMGCSSLTELDLSTFKTEKLTTMTSMFEYCERLEALDLSSFNTSNVTEMAYLFSMCLALKEINLQGFNTSSVTTTAAMFNHCQNLCSIYASDNWETEKVVDSHSMFAQCYLLVGGNGTAWSASNPTDITYARIDTSETPGYFTLKTS